MSKPALPEAKDFPSQFNAIIHLPSNAQLTNILLCLPGLGDTSTNFSSFACALNLPDTCTITLQPPYPLPYPVGPGYSWSDDLHFDQSTGELDAQDSPVNKSISLIADVVIDILIKKYHFQPGQIHLFGYGQGGSVALGVGISPALNTAKLNVAGSTTSTSTSVSILSTNHQTSILSLGSIMSLGGPLPLSVSSPTKSRTPILLLGGSQGAFGPTKSSSILKRTRSNYEFVEHETWSRNEDSLPRNREKVLPMMKFWGRRLKSRRGVPEDAVEVG